ncbi:hypothetical protein [Pedobacter xixiisoli]|uniref:Uncharacterized protein n=1 Tax=Pedobacter xixiisoli TaxID=1476464 RepID=A0A286A8Z7_9SPHI|nr:hypothetical protein [Pedobacter xixiisoli]SOD18362.1 hypothetical protein SAMN06297358_2961 [Pedobacter xixiisoli]
MGKKQILIRIYLFISVLVVLNVVLYGFWQMSFVGYWSDRVIFWIWLLLTPVTAFSFWKKLWAKIYFWLLIAGLVLSIVPMAIPFFGILLSASGSGRLNHFNLENNIRVQTVGYGVMGRPRIQLVKSGLLFDRVLLEDGDEIKKNDSTWLEIRDAKNAKLINETDTSITVKYSFQKDTIEAVHVFKEKTSFNY